MTTKFYFIGRGQYKILEVKENIYKDRQREEMVKIQYRYSRNIAKQSDTPYAIMNIIYIEYDFNNFLH